MRCMKRNKSTFYYASYAGREPMIDEYGNVSGEWETLYGDPIEERANISAAQGETQARQFGESLSYDKVVVMDNPSVPIDEFTILWVDTMPNLTDNGSLALDDEGKIITPHDYIVKKVARSLNSVSFAISKVTVSG